jgi:hypothetical protein
MARLEERRWADLLEHLEALHVRHPDLEHDEIGVRLADERQDLRSVLRLPDHFEASVLVECAADAVDRASAGGRLRGHGQRGAPVAGAEHVGAAGVAESLRRI